MGSICGSGVRGRMLRLLDRKNAMIGNSFEKQVKANK